MNDDSTNRRRSHVRRRVRGQSEIVGVVLLLALVLMGVSVIVTFGSATVSDIQSQSQVDRAEHAMTLFDSQAAMVALGDSEVQSVTLPSGGNGRYSVRENAGWIRVRHVNFTGNEHDETIYNESLGAVLYQTGDVTLAYQGGGVWRKRGNGSTMVSAPEFYYRGSTLTLPITRVRGSDGGSGDVTAHVESKRRTQRVFPNLTASPTEDEEIGAPYDVDDRTYRNPVKNGTVNVTIHSAYYQGWASYFRARTDGNVTVDPTNRNVMVELESTGIGGKFQMPAESNSVKVLGIKKGHAIDDFTITLEPPSNHGGNIPQAGFNNMDWSFVSTDGNKEFEIHLRSKGKQKCKNGEDFSDLSVGVYYSNETDITHEWENPSVDPSSRSIKVACEDLDDDGKKEPKIVAEFTGDTTLAYTEITAGEWKFDHSESAASEAVLVKHGGDSDKDELFPFHKGDTTTFGHLINHYVALMQPNVELTVVDNSAGSGNRISENLSYGTLNYERGTTKFITFLHISENEIHVELD